MNVSIPKYDWTKETEERREYSDQAPCWVPVVNSQKERIKPIIVCQCGKLCGIGLHHVHADGRVTASFFHTKDGEYGDPEGCEWHVFLQLLDYDQGEFLPNKK